ncbi:MAG: 4-hydroxy-tetrahydrodipicolinate reductase [Rhodospirillaceae bacterium]|nr:4-hydroxy-tetrahydrodipicolinate reductase [Rhodospirillaceae bacterium]MBL6941562.1 4-hydroxy-tetrahydrodipicolinate reductase [Rhodospirillales bacterium]
MSIRVCVAGATGWTGSAVTRGILGDDTFELVGAVARSMAGQDIGGVTICATLAEALQTPTDVLIDYTGAGPVKDHVLYAIERGVAVVVGSSGMTAADFDDIAGKAEEKGVGVIGGGNFSVTATLMQHLALIAARHVPQFEVLDFAWAEKEDVPSGTARELAEKLGDVQKPKQARAIESLHGPTETRGADINGVQVHSVRLPGYKLRCEAVFGMDGERLSVIHEAGQSAEPYVSGTLLAAKMAIDVKGLVRGLDALLFGNDG